MHQVAMLLYRIERNTDQLHKDHPVHHLCPPEVTAIKRDIAAIRELLSITAPPDNPGITPGEAKATVKRDDDLLF